jgi:leucyl/phenylalanyl-tRNA--protein transferase
MPIYRLRKDSVNFPPAKEAEDNGLLAVGGDLSPERLVNAYINGIFPWYSDGEPILWWCPRERFVIIPSEIVISRSMRKFMNKTELRVTFNEAFPKVIHSCRKLREFAEGTWITDDMESVYNRLNELGLALSCEVWDGDNLVGGLYGVCIGKCFFGESMFSRVDNASKLALIALAKRLEENDFRFIDCQFHTPHLESMGGKHISYEEYINEIRKGIE